MEIISIFITVAFSMLMFSTLSSMMVELLNKIIRKKTNATSWHVVRFLSNRTTPFGKMLIK